MVQSGLTKALKGDYRFYQDDMNRTYGKPKERLDLTSAGKELGTVDAVIQAISSAKKRG
jgi:succinylglutamate desuccinylase